MTVVAITGASGFTGSRLARFMRDAGWDIRRLQRNGGLSSESKDPGLFHFVLGQPVDGLALQGVDLLVARLGTDQRAELPVSALRRPRFSQQLVPGKQRDPHSTSRIP